MSKQKKDILKEIYYFIEDTHLETGKPVILQTIKNKFCKKYNITGTTVERYLAELVQRKSPFRIRTWYDGNRYYGVPTVSRLFKSMVIMSIIVFGTGSILQIIFFKEQLIFDRLLFFIGGLWTCFIATKILKGDNKV